MKRKIWVISLISLIAILIYLFIFFIFSKKDESKEVENKEEITLLLDFIYYNKLMYFDNFNKSFKVENLTNEEIGEYIYYIYKDYFKQTNNSYLTKTDIDNMLKNVFGDKINYQHENLHYCEKCKKYHILYNKEEENYIDNKMCEEDQKGFTMAAPTSVLEKKENKYILSIKNIFTNYNENGNYDGFYGNYIDAKNKKNVIYDISKEKFSENVETRNKQIENLINKNYNSIENKLTEYKYVFEHIDGNIIFTGYEIIK